VLLIDGYNLLFAIPGFDPRELAAGRDRLVDRIGRYCRATGQRAQVYFDPRKRGREEAFDRVRRNPPVEVVLLSDVSADEAIRALVEESPDRTAYLVISSDREVSGAAKRRGFASQGSQEFLAEVELSERSPAAEKPDGCPPDQAEYWMKRFGLGGKPDEARGSP